MRGLHEGHEIADTGGLHMGRFGAFHAPNGINAEERLDVFDLLGREQRLLVFGQALLLI